MMVVVDNKEVCIQDNACRDKTTAKPKGALRSVSRRNATQGIVLRSPTGWLAFSLLNLAPVKSEREMWGSGLQMVVEIFSARENRCRPSAACS
jgi:hypothetical protein